MYVRSDEITYEHLSLRVYFIVWFLLPNPPPAPLSRTDLTVHVKGLVTSFLAGPIVLRATR